MNLLIIGIAFLGGIVQGVTGFGAGITMMMILPQFFLVGQAAGVSSCIGLLLCSMMTYQYRKTIQFKKALLPVVPYLLASSCSAYFSLVGNQLLVKRIFGVFLILLSIYFIFLAPKEKKKLNFIMSVACVLISGICDGLFGIGGPLMVLYFLNQTTTQEEYLGTIQCFFLVNSIYLAIFRFVNGILNVTHIPYILLGMFGIFFGLQIANKIVHKIDGPKLKQLTYIMIGIAGISNLF